MTDRPYIIVQPAPGARQPFAAWAVATSPLIRTWSATEFAVPPQFFTLAPEEILVGATVDGHLYRAVTDAVPVQAPAVQDDYDPDQAPKDAAAHARETKKTAQARSRSRRTTA